MLSRAGDGRGTPLAFALIVAPIAAFATCVALAVILSGVPAAYVLGVPVAPALTASRARRTGCSRGRTWALAAVSLAICLVLLVVTWTILLVLLGRAMEDFG